MNNRLKFRVWDKLEKRLIYPDRGYQGHYVLTLNGQFHNLQNGSGGDECVVLQWTGLKDKNDRDIYEGDLVRYKYQIHEHEVESTEGEVYFEDGIFFFDRSMEWATNDTCFLEKSLEVVGNVFTGKEKNDN